MPVVKKISKLAGEDTAARLKKQLKQYSLKREEQEMVSQAIAQAAARVVAKLCYGLREEMEPQEWGPCLEGLLRSAKELK